jgi:small subunit ribosomal protein S19
MAKKYALYGKNIEELEKMSLEELANLLPTRARRSLKRGISKHQKHLLEKIRKHKGSDKMIRTHLRDMIILPEMVGSKLGVYNGKEFKMLIIDQSMIGHFLGEYVQTRGKVKHSSPGLGATKSSKFIPLK